MGIEIVHIFLLLEKQCGALEHLQSIWKLFSDDLSFSKTTDMNFLHLAVTNLTCLPYTMMRADWGKVGGSYMYHFRNKVTTSFDVIHFLYINLRCLASPVHMVRLWKKLPHGPHYRNPRRRR